MGLPSPISFRIRGREWVRGSRPTKRLTAPHAVKPGAEGFPCVSKRHRGATGIGVDTIILGHGRTEPHPIEEVGYHRPSFFLSDGFDCVRHGPGGMPPAAQQPSRPGRHSGQSDLGIGKNCPNGVKDPAEGWGELSPPGSP